MGIASRSIEEPLLTWILALACFFGGVWGFYDVGRLEDPAFTIKRALVSTVYPGATAKQVADEVSEPLESSIQKMAELEIISSVNRPGVSIIEVEIKSNFDGDELPAIWVKLRNRVDDAARSLPSGVSRPLVNDSFGDVFGIMFAVTAQGYSDAEKHELARFLRREILAVEGVADVEVAGLPEEAVFVEPIMPIAINLNAQPAAMVAAIRNSNLVVPAGYVNRENARTIIQAPQGSETVEAIAGLSLGVAGQVIKVYDFASVYRGRELHPRQIIRFDGIEAFTLGVAGIATENIAVVGKRVDRRLAELNAEIPIGVELIPIYQQHHVVEKASNTFLQSLLLSVTTVILVLAAFMGWRAALAVGSTLLLTVAGTFFFMAVFGIEMERISLGALIIVMGMLVDNAIVIAEGMQVEMQRGQTSREAAQRATERTQVPLLGATVIGILAFAGIGLSPDLTGEFMFSLFAVVTIALLLSWLLSITITPLLGHYLFQQSTSAEAQKDPYGGILYRIYQNSLRLALSAKLGRFSAAWLVVAGLVVLTASCFAGFGLVKQQFFPNSNTPIFFVHYKLPQGSDINATSADMEIVERWLAQRDEVESVATFIGQGATRFMLTYTPESPDPTYGHLIIRARSLEQIPSLRQALEDFGREHLLNGEFRTERLVFGPSGGAPISVRFSGPDAVMLRELAEQAKALMSADRAHILNPWVSWREQELVMRPVYATHRAQSAGVSREAIADMLRFATDGLTAGIYREGDRLIPIVVRQDKAAQTPLVSQMLYMDSVNQFIPLEQLIEGMEYDVQNTLIERRDRVMTISVNADVNREVTTAEAHASIREAIESIPLPVGYSMAWGGEYEDSTEAQTSLVRQLPVSVLGMVLISILLFGALRQPLIIWLLVPMTLNGVVIALLAADLPFSFTALLGLLSLSGMLIKNGIVLVDEIDRVKEEGVALVEALVQACTSRIRPVLLAAGTTILGMIPLLGDAFFQSMAVTIMGGLAFASVLALLAAPVLYYLLYRRESELSH